MTEKIRGKELVVFIASLGLLSQAFFAMPFTKRQKEWLDERDNNKCQAWWKHKCNDKLPKNRHKHHILPQRYCELLGIDPDFALNGITLCSNSHLGNIHPDIAQALKAYGKGDKQAIERVMKEREEKLSKKEIYWNSEHDRGLHAKATKNTQRFDKPWPERRKRAKK